MGLTNTAAAAAARALGAHTAPSSQVTGPAMQILLVGRTRAVIDEITEALNPPGVAFQAATTLDKADDILASTAVDHVIVGGGLELETRMEIVRHVFETSTSTTVHMNSPSGPESYLPFVA